MTSLIFGSIYMGHKGYVSHRREKQRQKNYERWEGLRDEYDEQRKISRESRSLDLQRTGAGDFADPAADDRPILTLRDQQEANDTRTSWRPQESFDRTALAEDRRRASVEVTAGAGLRPFVSSKTGATWDGDLPQPLRVSRRTWDDYRPAGGSGNASSSSSPRETTPSRNRSVSHTPQHLPAAPSPRHQDSPWSSSPVDDRHTTAAVTQPVPPIQPIQHDTPGGRMAELIEMSNPQVTPSYGQPVAPPFTAPSTNPFAAAAVTPAPLALTNSKGDGMVEWWNRP